VNQVRISGFTTRTESKVVMRLDVMPAHKDKIDQCVGSLCNQGCSRVTGYIAALRAGQEFPEVAELSGEERRRVLEELESNMAANDGSCKS
jgi:hypothetical protein